MPVDSPHGTEALELLIKYFPGRTVLDIGAGNGVHAAYMRQQGYDVTTISWAETPGFACDIVGDYNSYHFTEPFDIVWASHVLEHQANVGCFLRKVYRDMKPGGTFAITVPPGKPSIVGGHLTLWNAGLLLYNLIVAGFDCRGAAVKRYGYNISIVCRKRCALLPSDLTMDCGDIEKLAPFFPFAAVQGFDGDIFELNWDNRMSDARPVAGRKMDFVSFTVEELQKTPAAFLNDRELLQWAEECAEGGLDAIHVSEPQIVLKPLALLGIAAGRQASLADILISCDERLANGTAIVIGGFCPWSNSDALQGENTQAIKDIKAWMRHCGRKIRFLGRDSASSAAFIVAA